MTRRASGEFEVKLSPLPAPTQPDGALMSRMALDKKFHGDLEAVSQGEMLAAGTAIKGSAGYVALERVTGTLHGRRGSFTLQHSATMNRGTPMLTVIVVPDSGVDELTGIAGRMAIRIAENKHFYEFEYTLTEE